MNAEVKSIRSRMTVRILVGTAALLVIACTFLGILFHLRIAERFDETLQARADALMSLIALDKEILDFDFNDDAMPDFALPEEDDDADEVAFFDLLLRDGTSLRKSPSLAGRALARTSEKPEEPDEPVLWNHALPNGQPGRLLEIEFAPEIEIEEEPQPEVPEVDEDHLTLPDGIDLANLRIVLIVGRSRAGLIETLTLMYGSLAALVVIVLAGIALVLRHAFKKDFQPVHELNAQLRAMGPGTLDARISLQSPREELATIEVSVNHLLERVASGFERERRFSSNVAHELRTPVTELRSACEVGGRWPDDPVTVRALFEDIRGVGLHMEKVVETLLTLARCESGSIPVECEPVVLEPVFRSCWRRVSEEACGKHITLDLDVPGDLSVESDPGKLEMILQNLIENAVAHSKPDTAIRCTASRSVAGVVVTISNHPEDLEPDDLPRLFERCWQKNPARTDDRRTGLGLSIAQALADLLGIRITTRLDDAGVFEVSLTLNGAC
jgi:two-component system sensor histidine kinase QseC